MLYFIWGPKASGKKMSYFTWGPKASGRKSRIISYFIWGPKASGGKCRILRGVLRLVAESVVFYVGS